VGADLKLVLLFGALHLIGLGLAALLLVLFVRSDTAKTWSPPEDDDGGSGNDRRPPRRRGGPGGGGLPLPDALPARVRMRGAARLRDLLPRPERRPAHEPSRTPARPVRASDPGRAPGAVSAR
jgi:hypothetical protein